MPNDEVIEREVTTVETGTVALLERSQIDQQIATARKYPREITTFHKEMRQMVTLSEAIAAECIYALPRDGKVIEGPSARFAEVAASAWGNCRAGARVVNEGAEFVTAQGVFQDLQRNVAITYEVQRRITNSKGRRYKADMIGVTANAACSIALRNAILKGIPKAFWAESYELARRASIGDVKSIANKRADAIKAFVPYGVTEAQVLARLGRAGVDDITIDDLITLKGFLTAIKDGDSTPESVFAEEAPATSEAVNKLNESIAGKGKAPPVESGPAESAKAPAAEAEKPAAAAQESMQETRGGDPAPFTYAEVRAKLENAKDDEEFALARDMIRGVKDEALRKELTELADDLDANEG